VAKLRKPVLAVLFAAAFFAGLMFLFSGTSVIESFQLYPHDEQGGDALFLIEVILALISAAMGGLLFYHRLASGSWFPREKNPGDNQRSRGKIS